MLHNMQSKGIITTVRGVEMTLRNDQRPVTRVALLGISVLMAVFLAACVTA